MAPSTAPSIAMGDRATDRDRPVQRAVGPRAGREDAAGNDPAGAAASAVAGKPAPMRPGRSIAWDRRICVRMPGIPSPGYR